MNINYSKYQQLVDKIAEKGQLSTAKINMSILAHISLNQVSFSEISGLLEELAEKSYDEITELLFSDDNNEEDFHEEIILDFISEFDEDGLHRAFGVSDNRINPNDDGIFYDSDSYAQDKRIYQWLKDSGYNYNQIKNSGLLDPRFFKR